MAKKEEEDEKVIEKSKPSRGEEPTKKELVKDLKKQDKKGKSKRPAIDGREITPNPALERSMTETEKSMIEQRNTTQEEVPIETEEGGEEGGGDGETGGGGATVEVPTFSPPAGSYPSAQSVVLASTTIGAAIHYTIDGSEPTAASPAYTAPVPVSATSTIKAIGVLAGQTDSAVASADYTITAARR